jgi:hypothetical protein
MLPAVLSFQAKRDFHGVYGLVFQAKCDLHGAYGSSFRWTQLAPMVRVSDERSFYGAYGLSFGQSVISMAFMV